MSRFISITAHDMSPYDIAFFYDFILFLERLKEKPIKRILTGAISLTDISDLMKHFKTRDVIEEYEKFGWSLCREDELEFLTQIKFIAESMFLIYNHKGLLLLFKNGKGFLNNLEPSKQYEEMVLHYWYRVNWGYFTLGQIINDYTMAEKIQHFQNLIWQRLIKSGREWIDYPQFCRFLKESIPLKSYVDHEFDPKLHFHIKLVLFKRNLERLGCVEVMEEGSKYDKEIVQFRSTYFGLSVYDRAIFKNYL